MSRRLKISSNDKCTFLNFFSRRSRVIIGEDGSEKGLHRKCNCNLKVGSCKKVKKNYLQEQYLAKPTAVCSKITNTIFMNRDFTKGRFSLKFVIHHTQ